MIKELEAIFQQWMTCTNRDPQSNVIRLGYDSDWICKNAIDLLKIDETGILSAVRMRQAFRTYISETKVSIQEILSKEWRKRQEEILKLKALLYTGWAQQVYNKFANILIKNSEMLGKPFTKEDLERMDYLEKTIIDAFKQFKDGYSLSHEKFSGGTLIQVEPQFLPVLFFYSNFQEFVQDIKNSSNDNFICFSYVSDKEDEYNKAFVFGFKNNGTVMTVSDRDIFSSPHGRNLSRNPGRSLYDKLQYSHLSYDNVIGEEEYPETTALIEYTNTKSKKIGEILDDEALIWILLILGQIRQKYFIDIKDDLPQRFFASQIKLLPNITTAIVKVDELNLPVPQNNITLEDLIETKETKYTKSYMSSFYDYYLDLYPLPQADSKELIFSPDFIGTEIDAMNVVWWQKRVQQKDYINRMLEVQYNETNQNHGYPVYHSNTLHDWFGKKIKTNANYVIDFLLGSEEYFPSRRRDEEEAIAKIIAQGQPLPFYSLNINKVHVDKYTERALREFPDTMEHDILGTLKWIISWGHIIINTPSSTQTKTEYIFKVNTYTDFELLLGIKREELPQQLRRYLCDVYSFDPYMGNSILGFTDPIEDIKDPFNKLEFVVTFYISKTELNMLEKLKTQK